MLCKHEWVEVPEAGTKRRFVFRCSHCTAIFWLVFDGPALRVHVEHVGDPVLVPADLLVFINSLFVHHGVQRLDPSTVFFHPSPVPPTVPVKRCRRTARRF